MALEEATIALNVIGNEKSARDIKEVEDALEDLKKQEKANEKAAKDLDSAERDLNRTRAGQEDILKRMNAEEKRLNKNMKRNTVDGDAYKKNQADLAKVQQSRKDYLKGLSKAESDYAKVVEAAKNKLMAGEKELDRKREVWAKKDLARREKVAREVVSNAKAEQKVVKESLIAAKRHTAEVERLSARRVVAAKREFAEIKRNVLGEIAQHRALRSERFKTFKQLDNQVRKLIPIRARALRLGGIVFIVGGLISDALGFVATGLNALGAGAIGAVNGLVPVLGALGSLPTLLLSLGAVGFATSYIFGGLSKAYAGNKEELKKLGPETAKFLKMLKSLNGGVSLRRQVQESFFAGLGDDIKQLNAVYFPRMLNLMRSVAKSLNSGLINITGWMVTQRGIQVVDKVLGHIDSIVRDGSLAVSNFFVAFIKGAELGGSTAEMFAQDILTLSYRLSKFLDNNGGAIEAFYQRGYKRLKGILSVLGDFTVGLYNLFKQSAPMTNYMAEGITKTAKAFRKWASDPKNAPMINKYFVQMVKNFKSIVRFAGAFLKAVFKIGNQKDFVKIMDMLSKVLVPALTTIINEAQGHFLVPFINMINAIAAAASGGLLESAGKALALVARGVTELAHAFASLPPWARDGIVFGALFGGAALTFLSGVGGTMSSLYNLVVPASKRLANAIRKNMKRAVPDSLTQALSGGLGVGDMAAGAATGGSGVSVIGGGKNASAARKTGAGSVTAASRRPDFSSVKRVSAPVKKIERVAPVVGKAGRGGKAGGILGLLSFIPFDKIGAAIGRLGPKILQLAGKFKFLGSIGAGPIGIIIGLVLALGGAFLAANSKAGTFGTLMGTVGATIKSTWVDTVLPALSWAFGQLKQGMTDVAASFKLTADGGSIDWTQFTVYVVAGVKTIMFMFTGLIYIIGGVIRVITTLVSFIVVNLVAGFRIAWSIIKLVGAVLYWAFQKAMTPIKGIGAALKKHGIDPIEYLKGLLTNNPITAFFYAIKEAVKGLFEGTGIQSFQTALASILDMIRWGGTTISGFLDSITGKVMGSANGGMYTGGTLAAGGTSMVNELGPEIAVTRSGKMGLMNGGMPGFYKANSDTAVIPASASSNPFGGNYGKAPDWARQMLQRAAGVEMAPGMSPGVPGNKMGGETEERIFSPTVTIQNMTVASDYDIQSGISKALKAYNKEYQDRR